MKSNKNSDNKLWAFVAVFFGIIGFLLVFLLQRKNKYAMFYAKESLALFLIGVLIGFTGSMPFVGWVSVPLSIGMFVLWIFGIVYAISGEKQHVPLTGELAKQFTF